MDLTRALARAAPGVPSSEQLVDTVPYARDLWPRHHLEVRAGDSTAKTAPRAVVWPRTTAEVAAIVRLAASLGVPVVPFGAGSGVCAGVLPGPEAIVIDLKLMTAWRAFDRDAPLLDVEAGALGVTLEERLQRRGFTAGHFPSSILCSTVGGWLAARGAGQCSGKYGKIEDMVAELELVDGRGDVVTLRRRDGGVDLTPLVIGSEGTLGVITSATLRLHANPTSRVFVAYSFPGVEAGWTAMRRMFQAGLRPAVSRLYDPFDSFLANQGGVRAKKHGPPRPGGGTRALAKILRAPRLLNGLIDGIGDRVLGDANLVLIFEGHGDEPYDDAARADAIARELGATSLGDGPAKKWLQHRYSVSYRQAPVFMGGAFSDTMEVAAPWSRLAGLYRGVRRALGRHVFVMAHLSHAYPDGCSIYFTFAGAAGSDAECLARYDRAWRDAMTACLEAGGALSHHHGVGRSKAPRVPSELGEAGLGLLRATMRAFDPSGILNPGALVPADTGQATSRPPMPGDALALDELSQVATLPGDMTLEACAAWLGERGYELGGAPDLSRSVDAWIAAGAPGAPDRWEDPVDHLIVGLRADTPRGALALAPSPRRAVGPDLFALFVGGGGRAGRVRAADVRVTPKGAPRARALPFTRDRSPSLGADEQRLFDAIVSA
ncbi:MAG: FAD-binding oxidoreductase [Polyangiaceae bacterium]|nr:FAD-binding oxidoreductase [Polyangiaceae bacterium]